MSEFDKVMSERSDFELFEIINHEKDNYKTEALLAAKKEFESRKIDKDQLTEFKQKIESTNNLKRKKENQKTELKKKALDIGKLFVPTEKETLSKTLLSLCIFLTLSYMFYFIRDLGLLLSFFSDFGDWDFSVYEFLVPYVLFPIGVFGLWKSKKYGWYLTAGLLTYYAFSTIYSGISSYRYSIGGNGGIFDQLDSFFPRPSILSIIFRFIVLFGIVIFINRAKVLEKFEVQKTRGIIYLVIIFLVTTSFWWTLL